jgi:alpha-1,2-mannosyltransferase
VFLNLTLGQNGLFLLIAVLIIGQTIRAKTRNSSLWATIAWVVAIGAKLFPLIWLGALPFLRRWQLFVLAILTILLTLGLTTILTPTASWDYWLRFLPQRVLSASEQVGIDDQSLVAWLDRLGCSHTFRIPGLSVTQRHTVTWSPPWSVDPHVIRLGGYFLVALLALIPLMVLLRMGHAEAEGAFYLWVLYGLIVFPHMERYNHVLLLPAMAWLWSRGSRGRNLVILAYFLAGLSRLTHLWAILLPAPWGPLASGFGLYAVLVLGGGMATFLRPSKLSSMAREGQP